MEAPTRRSTTVVWTRTAVAREESMTTLAKMPAGESAGTMAQDWESASW
jgi:hypothetical protein